ncbi:hypothetical protein P691DRAFT_723248 [Macrolepiota fuliginosa MF-IS2]|uniref:Uncharacterized protein n=1 Tax=Macrolepiota fuliginosa MF-IS2 TaxID=1400762 RepID=A0A9P5XJG6_9AGAR|nr:hypothetical protein P691DRAFT_723248 [Macrolepiota fuliginosa MF-IS2]
MKDLALRAVATETIIDIEVPNPQDPEPHRLPPSYRRLKDRWETFIDILIKEWTTLNIVSALLVPGVLTMFQIAGGAAADPVTRYLSFWSLLSALLSLLYGCMFIVRFSRMRKTYIIIEWTMALRHQGLSSVFWNVPVMLAMPVLWLTWSIIIFIVCIMWFMWRVGTPPPDGTMVFSASPNTALGFRIFLCVTLGIGLFYGGLILFTFNKYGEGLDKKWKVHLTGLLAEAQDKQKSQTQTPGANSRTPSSSSQAFASQNLSSLQYNQHPGTNSRLLAPQARRRNPQGQHESPSRTPSPNRSNQHSTIDPTNYDMA